MTTAERGRARRPPGAGKRGATTKSEPRGASARKARAGAKPTRTVKARAGKAAIGALSARKALSGKALGEKGVVPTAASALYAYCLVQADREPAMAKVPAGLPGSSPARALAAGPGRWLIVADAPLERYSAAAIEGRLDDLDWLSACAVGHEAVCHAFIGKASAARGIRALLPMKMFTLFASSASALAELRRDRARTTRLLHRLAGTVEWGVRIHFDPARRAAPASPASTPATGRAFLERKREERDAAKNAIAAARAGARHCFDVLAGVAKAAQLVAAPPDQPPGSLLIEGNFLHPAARQREFERALQKCAESLLPLGCEVVLSGPWPAYHFLDDAGAPGA